MIKLGKAFGDSVLLHGKRSPQIVKHDRQTWWLGVGRVLLFVSIGLIGLFVLVARLFQLTVVQGHSYRLLADSNRTRELVRHAPRGLLLDRTGKPLVQNIGQYRLLRPCEATEQATQQGGCVKFLTTAEGESLLASGLPAGQFLEVDYLRRYVYPQATAHVVGYTGEMTPAELADEYYQLRRYRSGDRIGRVGAEAVYEDSLRGRDGRELVEIDASGRILRILGRDPEVGGSTVSLTLDAELSQIAYEAFPKDKRGTVIVSKPQTGEILVLFSHPTYDPNMFSTGISQAEYEALVGSPDRPLFNRAIGGVYPPASTYKLVTSLAGLAEGIITPQTIIEDNGTVVIGPYSFANWYFTRYGKTEGPLTVAKALARSNDIFYYVAGDKIGIDILAKWSRLVGLGKPLGIELPGEASGLVPDPVWKNSRFSTVVDLQARNNLWYTGDTYHMAIGQGYLLATPLQVIAFTNIFANTGKLCRPTIEKSEKFRCVDLGIASETLSTVVAGMHQACDDGGTGWPLFNFTVSSKLQDASSKLNETPATKKRIPVACKTGTAEIGDPTGKTHAWFTVFAPIPARYSTTTIQQVPADTTVVSGEPELSVTVLVEEGGEGSSVAAPIAKAILEKWFSR